MNRLWIVVLAFGLVACQPHGKEVHDRIAVSILPHKYFVERIAGNDFRVDVLVAPGTSHENYDPTPRQMKDLAMSRAWLANGFLSFEDQWKGKFLETNPELKVFDLSEGIETLSGSCHDHEDGTHTHGSIDPHFWLSPGAAVIIANNVFEALSQLKPDQEERYRKNLDSLQADLAALHHHTLQGFEGMQGKAFLIFHPALTYFAEQYGLEQIAIEKEGKNPSAQGMKEIIDRARHDNIRVILVQSQFDQENARTIAREIGGRAVAFDPMAADWLTHMYLIADTLSKSMKP